MVMLSTQEPALIGGGMELTESVPGRDSSLHLEGEEAAMETEEDEMEVSDEWESSSNSSISENDDVEDSIVTKAKKRGKLKPFLCPAKGCSRSYKILQTLQFHVKLKHDGKNIESLLKIVDIMSTGRDVELRQMKKQDCDMCGVKVLFTDILQHVQSHVGDYAVQCPNSPCPFVFSNSYPLMTKHRNYCRFLTKEERKQKVLRCETCGFTTDKRIVLKSHVQRNHERASTKSFTCPIATCDKEFSVRQSVDFHLSTHNLRPITSQECDICKKYIRIGTMGQHLRGIHKVKENMVSCHQCSFVFSSRHNLIEHLFTHRHEGMSCDLCKDEVKYHRHSDLVRHYTNHHQLDCKTYSCEMCSTKFFFKGTLNDHLKVCAKSTNKNGNSRKPKRFPCEACCGSVIFSTERCLIYHKITFHGETPFTCASCHKTFPTRSELSRHEKEHSGLKLHKKEYRCEVEGCGKIYCDKKGLTSHLVLHGIGGHFCNLCDKKFTNPNSLKIHRQVVHEGVKPYVCETCGDSFTEKKSLKRHSLIHSGERPFACHLCDQRFRQSEVLKRHVDAHEQKGAAFNPLGPMEHGKKRKAIC